MNDDKLLIAQAEDKLSLCRNRNYTTNTLFLDLHQQSVLRKEFRGMQDVVFWGGFEGAERAVMVCLPDYMEEPAEELFSVIHIQRVKQKGKPLGHGDYLGSLTGLGVKREMMGDILVREDGADAIVLTEIADFIQTHYGKAGRVELSTEIRPLSQLMIPEGNTKEITDTVASVRLDNVVSSAFGLARSKASAAIQGGIVFVDHVECLKPDQKIEEGTMISVRHMGRAKLTSIGGQSRKGRYYITIEKY